MTKEELKKVLSDFGLYLDRVQKGLMLSAQISGRMRFIETDNPDQIIAWINEIELEKRTAHDQRN